MNYNPGYVNFGAQVPIYSGDIGGSVGPVGWFRINDSLGYRWMVDITVGGQWLTARAVTDDFGALVLTSRLQ